MRIPGDSENLQDGITGIQQQAIREWFGPFLRQRRLMATYWRVDYHALGTVPGRAKSNLLEVALSYGGEGRNPTLRILPPYYGRLGGRTAGISER